MTDAASADGRLVCVVGPSGAGKDTLMALARRAMADDARIVFPRRLVTRGANAFEDNDPLSEEAFRDGVANDRFALHWRAHGLGYALPLSVRDVVAGGRIAVCNVSRASLSDARARFAAVDTILVTAPEDVRAARLAARGRESAADAADRLARGRALECAVSSDLTIVNVGDPQEGASRLTAYLQTAASSLRRT